MIWNTMVALLINNNQEFAYKYITKNSITKLLYHHLVWKDPCSFAFSGVAFGASVNDFGSNPYVTTSLSIKGNANIFNNYCGICVRNVIYRSSNVGIVYAIGWNFKFHRLRKKYPIPVALKTANGYFVHCF